MLRCVGGKLLRLDQLDRYDMSADFNCVDQQMGMSQEEVDRDQLCLSGWPPERVAGL